MAGFADLVPQAQPAIFGGGVSASGAAGRTWSHTFVGCDDADGTPIDLTAATGTCKIVDTDRTTAVLTLTVTGGIGEFTVSATKAATAALFTGSEFSRGRVCYWSCTLDDGTRSVQVWMVDNSPFTIRKGA